MARVVLHRSVDDPACGDAAEKEQRHTEYDKEGQDADDPFPVAVPCVLDGGPTGAAVGAGLGIAGPAAGEVVRGRAAGEEAQQPKVGPPGHDFEGSLDQVAVIHVSTSS